ncbi:MAG: CPBP family intramembrane metalloprotease [Lachnospiraceae bacterium]|jgi:membrane protease YdiL (CAAX protease family)|nr:CPBP family intramembrane metalloprotease [Lachnospiraceae bacterium]
MNTKLTAHFLVITFVIMLAAWGTVIILAGFGIAESTHPWVLILQLIGGLSPTIASYIALKRSNMITGFKEWLKLVFNAKSRFVYYLAALAPIAAYHLLNRVISDVTEPSLNMLPLIFVICFFMGGLEEAGWRSIFQPELEKKFGFIITALIFSIIWFVWHLPLYFIPEISEGRIDMWFFLFVCIMTSFFYGAIRRITGSIFLAILAHTLSNTLAVTDGVFLNTWSGIIGSTIVFSLGSIIAVRIYDRKCKEHDSTD